MSRFRAKVRNNPIGATLVGSFIAWENFPPEDAAAATVRSGLANLQRARAIKRNAAEERIVEHHVQALAKAHRKVELAQAKADPTFVSISPTREVRVADHGCASTPNRLRPICGCPQWRCQRPGRCGRRQRYGLKMSRVT